MTTLQLAEKIARAVLTHIDRDECWDVYFTGLTDVQQVVLRTLDENQAWFCRMPVEDDGSVHEEKREPFPYQRELFT